MRDERYYIDIYCDRCDRKGAAISQYTTDAIKQLIEAGWRRIDNIDLCASCVDHFKKWLESTKVIG